MLKPTLIFEMKILKYTFSLPKLQIDEKGELIENGITNETYTFTLLHKGIGIFEELAHKPLMSYLMDINLDDSTSFEKLLSKDFIPNLACASYVKIEGDKFHNNRATAEEFKKTQAYPKVTEDLNFVKELLQMSVECVSANEKAKAKTKQAVDSKK